MRIPPPGSAGPPDASRATRDTAPSWKARWGRGPPRSVSWSARTGSSTNGSSAGIAAPATSPGAWTATARGTGSPDPGPKSASVATKAISWGRSSSGGLHARTASATSGGRSGMGRRISRCCRTCMRKRGCPVRIVMGWRASRGAGSLPSRASTAIRRGGKRWSTGSRPTCAGWNVTPAIPRGPPRSTAPFSSGSRTAPGRSGSSCGSTTACTPGAPT